MAGRVDDDVVARARLEEDAGGVDRDALRALVLERVEQERVLERLGGARAQRLHLLELALGQRVGVGEQPADDRALAVIDVAADHDVHPAAGRHLHNESRVAARILQPPEPCRPRIPLGLTTALVLEWPHIPRATVYCARGRTGVPGERSLMSDILFEPLRFRNLREQGLVPDAIIRGGIRRLLRARLAELRADDAEHAAEVTARFVGGHARRAHRAAAREGQRAALRAAARILRARARPAPQIQLLLLGPGVTTLGRRRRAGARAHLRARPARRRPAASSSSAAAGVR